MPCPCAVYDILFLPHVMCAASVTGETKAGEMSFAVYVKRDLIHFPLVRSQPAT